MEQATHINFDEHHLGSYTRLRVTASRLVSWQDADDLVQEAFVRALQAKGGFRAEAACSTWFYRILVNGCLDLLRQRRRRGPHVPLDPRMAQPFQQRDLVEIMALRRALRSISKRQRLVCYLHDVRGLTHEEIGSRLGIAVGTSKRALFDARRNLRRHIGQPG